MAQRKQFLLRISPELWEELNRWAADEFRSANGQIEFLLKRAVDERRGRSGRRVTAVQDTAPAIGAPLAEADAAAIAEVASLDGPDPAADTTDPWDDLVD